MFVGADIILPKNKGYNQFINQRTNIIKKYPPSSRFLKDRGVGGESYDCPCGQVISLEMLRIVMIGFAKFKNDGQSYHNVCVANS